MENEVVIDVICGDICTYTLTSLRVVYMLGDDTVDNQPKETSFTPRIYNRKNVFYHDVFTTGCEFFTSGSAWFGKLRNRAPFLPTAAKAISGKVCKQVAYGGKHTVIVTEDCNVYTFGCGRNGRLGHFDKKDAHTPRLVQSLETTDIKTVTCGQTFTIALTTSGYVYTWGRLGKSLDETARDFLFPNLVESLRESNVVQISCFSYRCAVLVDPSPCLIRQAQKSCFNCKEHSDVTFMVDNQALYGKTEVLSRKCQYFEAMFRSNMRESKEGVVVVPDVSVDVYLKLLEYLCLDDFVLKDDFNFSLREELGVLADMYMVDGLQLLCNVDIDS